MVECERTIHAASVYGGLGDQLTDFVGAAVFVRLLGARLVWSWPMERSHHVHGSLVYDPRLFDLARLDHVIVQPSVTTAPPPDQQERLVMPNASASSCPHLMLPLLRAQRGVSADLGVAELLRAYRAEAARVRPGPALVPYLLSPNDGAQTRRIGIHLRCTDKVTEGATDPVFVALEEFRAALARIVEDVVREVDTVEGGVEVFLCSERDPFKLEFRGRLADALGAGRAGRVTFLEPAEIPNGVAREFPGVHAVRDMFCLARCDRVYQSVNYSTFSLFASLAGGARLVNYSLGRAPTIQHGWEATETLCPLGEASLAPFSPPSLTM